MLQSKYHHQDEVLDQATKPMQLKNGDIREGMKPRVKG